MHVHGCMDARQTLRCPTCPPPASDKALHQPIQPWEKSAGHLEHFQALHSSMLPMGETLAPVASLASSVAKFRCEKRSDSLFSDQPLLVLKSLTLNFLHQLEAMSPARTGCHISKILNVCACSCPFFPYFSLLFLALNSKKNLRESLWRRKSYYSWEVIGFSSCFYIMMVLKKGTTHTVLKLLLPQYNFVSRAIKRSLG